jgi:hypothetical protein
MYHYDCFYICKDLTEGEINKSINQSNLMAEAGHVEQTVSVGIWYMPHNTCEVTCNCIYKPLHELFIKPDVLSNLLPFIIPLITPNGVQFHQE